MGSERNPGKEVLGDQSQRSRADKAEKYSWTSGRKETRGGAETEKRTEKESWKRLSVELGLDVIEEELGVYIEKIFERATIRGIADYLLFGSGPDEDNRSYEERLEEPYLRFEKAVAKYDKNPTSELLDLSNEVTSETASVYMEIGIQVGGLLMMDVIKNVNQ